jgi:hypothetical protein
MRWTTGSGIGALGGLVVTHRAALTVVPGGLWVVLIVAVSTSAVVAIAAIVCDFLLKNKAANLERAKADADAERAKIRETNYWTAMLKAAAEPTSSGHYAELSDAAARYVAVEKNGTKPCDRTHGNLYGYHPSTPDAEHEDHRAE